MNVYRPRGRVWQLAAPPSAVVSLADMKEHLRIHHADDDDQIVTAEAGAVAMIERFLQRALIARTAVLRLPGLPIGVVPVELPGGRVATLTSVIADGTTISGATVVGDSPALLVPSSDWPSVEGEGFPVVVTYEVGFATVPADIVVAVKMVAEALFYRHDGGPMSAAVHSLLDRHRIAAL